MLAGRTDGNNAPRSIGPMRSDTPAATALEPADHARWAELWRGYLTFYETELPADTYAATWSRILDPHGPVHALGARDPGGRLVGIVHYLLHPHAWSQAEVCYLQDLFVDANERGRGYARALIDGVAEDARRRGCFRLYWLTQESNATARRLYDAVARYTGFIRYDFPLD
jgi:GNAT superfamily N-acetyltransferase